MAGSPHPGSEVPARQLPPSGVAGSWSWTICSCARLSPGNAHISPCLGSSRKDRQLFTPEDTLQKTRLVRGPRLSGQRQQLYRFFNLLVSEQNKKSPKDAGKRPSIKPTVAPRRVPRTTLGQCHFFPTAQPKRMNPTAGSPRGGRGARGARSPWKGGSPPSPPPGHYSQKVRKRSLGSDGGRGRPASERGYLPRPPRALARPAGQVWVCARRARGRGPRGRAALTCSSLSFLRSQTLAL